LAIASVARNIGLALFIAEQSEATLAAIPSILPFAVIGVGLALPLSLAMKKH
jgi:BASS family bile acid:Na+ symporter